MQGHLLTFSQPEFTVYMDENMPSNTVAIFAHGLGATHRQVTIYAESSITSSPYATNDHIILQKPIVAFNFPDAKNDAIEYYTDYVNLGQQLDIQRLHEIYKLTVQEFPNHKIILCGVSRGAATILNLAATQPLEQVKAIIIESSFENLETVVKHLMKRFYVGWLPWSKQIGLGIANKMFPALDTQGIFPINVVSRIPNDLPILLVHSRQDSVVPTNSSRKIYKRLIETGHFNTYYLELASGEHARLLCGPEGRLYKNVVHAFYKKFSLPHDANAAQQATHLLNYCQPTIDEMRRLMKQKRCTDPQYDQTV